jgi:hypothetical protein
MLTHPPTLTVYKELSAMYLRYYVYAYLRKDGTPYYIGKGHGNRCTSKDHKVKVPSANRIVILESNLSELGAFAIERRIIEWYGRKDIGTGILRNKTDGGEGVSSDTMLGNTNARGNKGKPKSEEHKLKMRLAAKGKPKSEEQKLKQSQSMTGRTQSPEFVAKRTSATIGNKWWSKDGFSKKSRECPGNGWTLGRYSIRKIIK